MKILLYGETNVKGTGAWCYAQTIREMGHALLTYDNEAALEPYQHSFFWKVLRRLNHRQLLPFHQRRHFAGLLALARTHHPDIIVILKGLHFGKTDIEALKEYSPFVVNINHDDFFSLNPNNRSRRQFSALPAYDFLFTTRQVNVPELQPYNPHAELFMFAWYPPLHKQHALTDAEKQKWGADVLFVGTYERQRAALLEKLMQGAGFELAIYGRDWHHLNRNSALHRYIRSYDGIWGEDMPKAIAASAITLGFLRKENRDEYTQRSFEIPACGGLLLAERSPFHEQLYAENKEAVFFDPENADELRQKINHLLQYPDEAGQIRAAGHSKVINGQFSYADRIAQLVNRFQQFGRKNSN